MVLASTSSNLVAGQGSNSGDIFVYTASTGNIVLASHQPGSTNQGGNGTSNNQVVSRDGSYVFFASRATNLLTGESDANNATDIYGYNVATGTVFLVSHASGSATTTANAQSDSVTASANGQYVAFDSQATNLVAGYGNNKYSTGEETYVYSVSTGAVQLASHATTSVTAGNNQSCDTPFISTDGNYVAFDSTGNNLVPGDRNELQDVTNSDVFLYTRSADRGCRDGLRPPEPDQRLARPFHRHLQRAGQ